MNKPLTIDEENEQRETPLYRGFIIAFSVMALVLGRRAMIRLNQRIFDIRNNFFPALKRITLGVSISILVMVGIVYLINVMMKQKEWSEHKKTPEEPI